MRLEGRPSPASHGEVRTEDERGCGRRDPAQRRASITDRVGHRYCCLKRDHLLMRVQSGKKRDLKRLDDLR